MRALTLPFLVAVVLLASATLTAGCSRESSSQHTAAASPARSEALILQEADGERRVHRPPPGALSNLTALFTLKVDRRNGGAPEFVMMTEDIPPGQAISPHRHPHSDEIIFIYGGTGLASLPVAEQMSRRAQRFTCHGTP
jgi:quercetin dioxygenase-like cupin family protein